ncbi:helix-turn-helix domain-containing protein [Lysinibacillus sp. 1P01SD]|uniref:helix-turn-helix domain-containing protein n=1 Tax=Lysinibacillus sp. 1P01SD TaxID=3132285 RepID=UPI0039A3C372
MSDIVGSRIKELRKNAHYTQQQLADKISVSPQVISNWERGYTEPSADDIARLSEVLSCSSDYILGKISDISIKDDIPLQKDEKDIAKRLEKFRQEIENSDGLAFDGEPMSEEAKESLIESMEHIFRQTQRINKKYTPDKYKK